MKYICVKWIHNNPTEPILLCSELDSENWEVRKVEVWADDTKGIASEAESFGSTQLSEEPLPSLEEIASDPQFQPSEITKAEFETLWKACRSPTLPGQ
jgi:Domain of unknown function (DUF6881)